MMAVMAVMLARDPRSGSGANAFSGPGGDASGGSINEGNHRREYGSVLNLASGAYAVLILTSYD